MVAITALIRKITVIANTKLRYLAAKHWVGIAVTKNDSVVSIDYMDSAKQNA